MHLMAKCKLVPSSRQLMRIAHDPAVSKRNAASWGLRKSPFPGAFSIPNPATGCFHEGTLDFPVALPPFVKRDRSPVKRPVHCTDFRRPYSYRAMVARDLTQAKAWYLFSAYGEATSGRHCPRRGRAKLRLSRGFPLGAAQQHHPPQILAWII
jgi:hypothetical protein